MRRLRSYLASRPALGITLLAAMLVDQWGELALTRSVDVPTLYSGHVEKALLQWQAKKSRTLSAEL